MGNYLLTGISKAQWCSINGKGKAKFEIAEFLIGKKRIVKESSWFDKLFLNGIYFPDEKGKPLTALITGPPGTGKTTLSLELCYRLAKDGQWFDREINQLKKDDSLFSLYISTDTETDLLKKNAESFGWEKVDRYILPYNGEIPQSASVLVWGRESLRQKQKADDIINAAISDISNWLLRGRADKTKGIMEKLFRRDSATGEIGKISPSILVVDSLNILDSVNQSDFVDQFLNIAESKVKMVILVLDSGSAREEHKAWEYLSDIVIRLDHSQYHDYTLRSIEIIKSRYQEHILGKHRLKICPKATFPEVDGDNYSSYNEELRRSHPFNYEGGIFIFPSLPYYLSSYKRVESKTEKQGKIPGFAQTKPDGFDRMIGGFPEGRCTAFIGHRGDHKSPLAYLHLLYRICDYDHSQNESVLVISLRNHKDVVKNTLIQILRNEFGYNTEKARSTLNDAEKDNRLEILYYPPGYISPEEFIHRMFMSIYRMKQNKNRKLTVLFNSLDQLNVRFPLCASEEIFVPTIIEVLSGMQITSIFITVDEKDQPTKQYGMLPMADLIVSFYRHRFLFKDYYGHLKESLGEFNLGSKSPELQEKVKHAEEEISEEKIKNIKTDSKNLSESSSLNETMNILRNLHDQSVEAVVLKIVSYTGGYKSKQKGILELINRDTDLENELYSKTGLHFTRLSTKFSHGERMVSSRIIESM